VAEPVEPTALQIGRAEGRKLAGEASGPEDGAPLVLVHGLTATRRTVVHGSRTLERSGYRVIAYDARGHGESDPAADPTAYAYPDLADDLDSVTATGRERRAVLIGHSMGAHTIAAFALRSLERVAGVVFIGPAVTGAPASAESLREWDRLAAGLEEGGVEGFVRAYDHDLDPEWRDTLLRITRDRLGRHRHPEAVAAALRCVPRSQPFAELDDLRQVEVPALVVASHDEADPGHPYDVAAAWAEHLPQGRLVSEEPGQSPLAWQGGRLSREIAAFCEEQAVAERHST
jgi:pimeloyl-ACP methyl ester carboxylesterase